MYVCKYVCTLKMIKNVYYGFFKEFMFLAVHILGDALRNSRVIFVLGM